MTARAFTPADYAEVASWWEAQGWPVIPPEMLPGTGVVVPGLAAGFLYKTDSAIAILEFVVANPASDKMERRAALDAVIEALLAYAALVGARAVFTSCQHPSLLARYQNHGFQITDTGMTNLIRRI